MSLMVLLAFASLAAAQDSGEPLAHGGGVDGKAADHNVEAPQSSPPPPPPPSSSPPPAAPKQSAGARKAETSSASSKAAKTTSAACEFDVLLKEPVAVSLEVTGMFIAMSLALRWLPAMHPPHFDSAMANYWRSAPCTMNVGNFFFAFGGSPESAWCALDHILWPNALPSAPKIPSNLQRHDDRWIPVPSDPRPRSSPSSSSPAASASSSPCCPFSPSSSPRTRQPRTFKLPTIWASRTPSPRAWLRTVKNGSGTLRMCLRPSRECAGSG